MILARLAVYGAIVCTLWFNGSYAYAKASGEAHQLAMVAVALTIDLSKCGFLPAASHLWATRYRVPALVLFVMWPLAFSYSLFAGYAAITTNRTFATASTEGAAQTRARTQADYDQATNALAVATGSPLWTTTAACTAPKTQSHRQFCDGVTRLRQQQHAATTTLNASKPAHVDPELMLLADLTNFEASTLLLVIAFVPALILELVSSLGFYAVNRRAVVGASRTPAEQPSKVWFAWMRPNRKNASTGDPVASRGSIAVPPSDTPPASRVSWTVKAVS